MKHQLMAICMFSYSLTCLGQIQQNESNPAQNGGKNNTEKTDYATLKCYYLFTKKKEGSNKPYRQDTMALEIGATTSKFYDPARLGRDSILSERINNMQNISQDITKITILKDENAIDLSNKQGTISSKSNEGESYQIYKDRLSNTVKVIDYSALARDVFMYEEQIGALPWKITKEKETIQSYTCQKATLSFRGRDYIAWFTSDIPVNDGPWKFMGLPGLILKVEDSKQLFSFTMVGIEQVKSKVPLTYTGKITIKCTRGDFEKLKMKQGPGKEYNFNNGEVTISDFPEKYEYIPMELQ